MNIFFVSGCKDNIFFGKDEKKAVILIKNVKKVAYMKKMM